MEPFSVSPETEAKVEAPRRKLNGYRQAAQWFVASTGAAIAAILVYQMADLTATLVPFLAVATLVYWLVDWATSDRDDDWSVRFKAGLVVPIMNVATLALGVAQWTLRQIEDEPTPRTNFLSDLKRDFTSTNRGFSSVMSSAGLWLREVPPPALAAMAITMPALLLVLPYVVLVAAAFAFIPKVWGGFQQSLRGVDDTWEEIVALTFGFVAVLAWIVIVIEKGYYTPPHLHNGMAVLFAFTVFPTLAIHFGFKAARWYRGAHA